MPDPIKRNTANATTKSANEQPRRPLPAPPIKPAAAPTQFFPQAVELPQPPQGADINVQVRHWACIYGPKYTKEQIKKAFENAKKLIDTGLVDFTSTSPKGNTAIHSAARLNNMPFIDYALKHAAYKIDVDTYNTVSNSTALADLIAGGFFKSAIALIKDHHAEVNVLVRGQVKDKKTGKYENNDTCGLLFEAVVQALRRNHNKDTKAIIDDLIVLLVSKGLEFFNTPESSCPASFELGEKEFTLRDEDKERIDRLEIKEIKQYFKLYSMEMLEKACPKAFSLFKVEMENVKKNPHHPLKEEAQALSNMLICAEKDKVHQKISSNVSKSTLK